VILVDEFVVGGRNAAANVVIANGGTLQIGDEETWTDLSIGRAVTSANMLFPTTVDFRNASRVDLHLSRLTIGERIDTQGQQMLSGSLWGAGAGSVAIGTAEQRGEISIGNGLRSENVQGLADFRGMDQLTAYVREVRIGVGDASSALGTLYLTKVSFLDADSITVGSSNTLVSPGQSLLHLGTHSVIHTKALTVGSDMANGLVQISPGGALELGLAESPTRLIVAQSTDAANILNTSTVDLRGANATLYLHDVIVGERINIQGGEPTVGIVYGGNAGAITIGAADQRASVMIGHAVNASNGAGTFDLAGLDQMHAYLSRLSIGVGENGIGSGTMSLPRVAEIDAEQIVVGWSDVHNATGMNVLRLGQSSTILADDIQVGVGMSNGRVEAPVDADVQMGSPDRLTNLTIARGNPGQGGTHTSVVDLQSAQVKLHLANLAIGAGPSNGSLLTGNDADIRVDRIVLADGTGKGTLQFGGGVLLASEVHKGAGTALFNWTDGTVQVDRWGDPQQRFDLSNLGTGTLIAGAAANELDLFGSYRQGEFAELLVTIAAEGDVSMFNVHGTSELSGTLVIDVLGGASLSIGDRLPFLSYTARSGDFTSLQVVGNLHGLSLETSFDDAAGMAYLLISGVEGDVNGDGRVDLDDLNSVRNNFGGIGSGDADGDNDVDLDDLNAVRNNFGAEMARPVPEPATFALLFLCAAGVSCFLRPKKCLT
jgi:hypothetical protein